MAQTTQFWRPAGATVSGQLAERPDRSMPWWSSRNGAA